VRKAVRAHDAKPEQKGTVEAAISSVERGEMGLVAPLAKSVCDQAAAMVGAGVRLVGTCFARETVEVVLMGGVARSDYIQQAVARVLAGDPNRRYVIVAPAFPPEIGAALIALERHGVVLGEDVLESPRAYGE
jgi:sugar (pentulose or hexulose) kinase